MDNENENFNSLNEEKDVIDLETIDDISVLKEGHTKLVDYDKFKKVDDANKQLFARTKKAEGFELKEGKWVKTEPVKKPEPTVEPKKSDELDYGQLAYLTSKGVEDDAEIDFVKGIAKRTGESIKDVLKDDFVQDKLKKMRDEKIAKSGVPEGSPRSAVSSKTNVDYWVDKKDENGKSVLPPNVPENRQLRTDIVNARLAREKAKNMFQG